MEIVRKFNVVGDSLYFFMSKFVANILLKNESISKEHYDIYRFGLERIISDIFGFIYLGVTAFILSSLIEAIIFYLVFKYMRIYAGGYHANTYISCNIMYILTFVSAVILSKNNYLSQYANMLFTITLISVLMLSPIENHKNPINADKYYKYFWYSVMITIFCGLVQLIFILLKINLYNIVSVSMFLSVLFMWVEIIKRRKNPMVELKKKLSDLIAKKAAKSAVDAKCEVSSFRMYQAKMPKGLDNFIKEKK